MMQEKLFSSQPQPDLHHACALGRCRKQEDCKTSLGAAVLLLLLCRLHLAGFVQWMINPEVTL